MDLSEHAYIIYLDLSKAFDTVVRDTLLQKLESFGICGNLLQWFSYYLRDRKQSVVIDGYPSHWFHVTSDVPQGFILGLFLFLLFVNDLPASVINGKSLILADDTKL